METVLSARNFLSIVDLPAIAQRGFSGRIEAIDLQSEAH
jgi:hypothetical protein